MLQTKSFTMFPTEVYFTVFFLSWIIKISVSMPNWKNFMNYLTSTRIQKKVGKNLTIKLTRHQAGLSLISTSLSIHKRLSFLLYFLVFKKCLFLNCLMSMVKDIKKPPWMEMWSNGLDLRFASFLKTKLILLKSWNFWILFSRIMLCLDMRNFPPPLILLFWPEKPIVSLSRKK